MQVGYVEREGGDSYACMYCLWDVLCDPAMKCGPCGCHTQEVNVSHFIESTTRVHESENTHKKSSMHKYVCLLGISCTLQPQASACPTLRWRQQLIKRLENAWDETTFSQPES